MCKNLLSEVQYEVTVPSFEEKVAQRAIALLLEPVYEQDFCNCSFGFRTGRNAHQALLEIRRGIMEKRGRWVLEVDVRKYFDSIDHAKLRELLARRVTDGVVRRLIDKWLSRNRWRSQSLQRRLRSGRTISFAGLP